MSDEPETKGASDPPLPTELVFHNVKGNFFRVVHADGVVGSLTPQGNIQMGVYSERKPNPTEQTYRVRPDGMLGEEIVEKRVTKEHVVRELEVELIMTPAVAQATRDWLDQWLRRLREMTEE